MSEFINYAHRGASEYAPENTLLAFYSGILMGANGIETDVQKTKDGILVLFHDDTLFRVTGEDGAIKDYTYEELLKFNVKKAGLSDKIVTLEDFLKKFSHRDITFAIELKYEGYEKEVVDLIKKYNLLEKTVVTSFNFNCLVNLKKYAPEIKAGYLTDSDSKKIFDKMTKIGIEEYCPKASLVTKDKVKKWHEMGFNVRAWGVFDEELMKRVYDAAADGCTVNFPDKLTAYINNYIS